MSGVTRRWRVVSMDSGRQVIASRGLLVAAAILLAVVWIAAPVASAATVKPFLTLNAACSRQSDPIEYATGSTYMLATDDATASGNHEVVLVRAISQDTADVAVSLFGTEGITLPAQSATWTRLRHTSNFDVRNGDKVGTHVYACSPGSSFTFEFYDAPSTPVVFAGVDSNPGTGYPPPGTSTLAFTALESGHYVADVSVTQGAVTISFGNTTKTIASAGHLDFGTLRTNYYYPLTVEAKDGPPAKWQIKIGIGPVSLTGPTFDTPVGSPGNPLTADYSISRNATVNGSTLRSLATDLLVKAGDHSLTWDGLDASGSPVPAGTYTLALDVKDSDANHATGSATVQIDATGPAINLPPAIITPDQSVTVAIVATGSKIATVQVTVDGKPLRSYGPATTLSFKPASGWKPGKHTVTIVARDKLGNLTRLTRTIVVKPSSMTKPKAMTKTF